MAVDHVIPWVLMSREWEDGDLHQVRNLVLACYACNSANATARPQQTGCNGWNGVASTSSAHTISCARP